VTFITALVISRRTFEKILSEVKGTKLYSIFTFTCPRCQEGKLFVTKSSYTKGFAEMHKKCANCGQNFEPEPGFYFGAAYVSYALTVALWVALFVALVVFDSWGLMSFSFEEDPILLMGLGIGLLVVLLPLLYRLSRSIWISMFVKYDKNSGGTTS
jgi:uncharacterized protein (DUF983 family)